MAPWPAAGKGFPLNFSGCGMAPKGLRRCSGSAPDFGLHFFLYLRRDFLYYFR
jgi:hypothetical protein